MTTAMNAREYIADLGNKTVEEIRALCLEKGYKGEPGKPRRCPTAVLIKEETGQPVSVGSDDIDWYHQGVRFDVEPLPESLRDFIMAVDQGDFPELLLPETPGDDPYE